MATVLAEVSMGTRRQMSRCSSPDVRRYAVMEMQDWSGHRRVVSVSHLGGTAAPSHPRCPVGVTMTRTGWFASVQAVG
jgi:hypothetical protein